MDPDRRRAVERMLFDAHPHGLDYLRLLLNGPVTLAQIAAEMDVTPKTVRTALHDLDSQYRKLVAKEWSGRGPVADGGLLMRRGRNVTLTNAGRHVAGTLELMHARVVEAFDSALSAQVSAWLTVTNDCWEEFEALSRSVSNAVVLRPRSMRSSDLDLHRPHGKEPESIADTYAMYSVCMETSNVRKGQLLTRLPGQLDQNTEVVVIETEPFLVLGRTHTFGDVGSVTAESILSDGCELVVPEGGAVGDYLTLLDPSWRRRTRPVRATDLEACLGVLRCGGLSNPAMLIHGASFRVPPGFRTYELKDGPDAAAVRGLFHRRVRMAPQWSERDRSTWNEIWAAADKRWHTEVGASR